MKLYRIGCLSRRYPSLAGNFGLAQPASCSGHAVPFAYRFGDGAVDIRSAFVLVVTVPGKGSNRTTADACPARPFPVVQTIGATLRIRPQRRFNDEIGDHASQAMRNSFRSDQGII